MKKKYRNIVVNDKSYGWNVIPNCDPYEGGGTLKIWKNRKIIYDKDFNYDLIVTPEYVAELISACEDFEDISFK